MLDVLIVGAGPTGLVLALWLTKQGIPVRVIDKAEGPGTTSRAVAVQARTLELYRQLDLTDEVLAKGHRVTGLNLWVRGKVEARVALEELSGKLTEYGPFTYPQDLHERLLGSRLEKAGVVIERQTELVSFQDKGDRIEAVLQGPQGTTQACTARYLAGCDGARSAVRQALGVGFPGGTYQQLFYVADVDATGPSLDGELHIDLDEADFLAIFPLRGEGRARLIGTVRGDRADRADTLQFEDISERAIQNMKIEVRKVNWFSTYRVHHRVTDHFRRGRVFLLGDAAHIHSPAGGQGMNTGIGDAVNLAWKLAAVVSGRATEALLETYELERRAFAQTLVSTTDKAFRFATSEGPFADFVRTRLVPLVAPALLSLGPVREYLFGAVSQIVIAYPDSMLSEGRAGAVRGGDRLPWTSANYDSLNDPSWQLHVYGSVRAELGAWCESNGLRLTHFPWNEACRKAGLSEGAMYLLRPDTYVALADCGQDPQRLERYFARRNIDLTHGT